MRIRLISLAITLLAALALAPAAWAAPTTFTVNSTGDGAPTRRPATASARRAAFVCTLRAAIEESNATGAGAPVHDRASASRRSRVAGDGAPGRSRAAARFVDGCGVRRADVPSSTPRRTAGRRPLRRPRSAPARTIGLQVGDASSDPSGVAIYNLAITNFPAAAIRLWGADTYAGRRATSFGRRIDGTNEGNGVAVARHRAHAERHAGRTPRSATSSAEPSSATDTRARLRRLLQHDRQLHARGDRPRRAPRARAGRRARRRDAGDLDEGTTIAGNWIGVDDAAGHRRRRTRPR